MQIKAQLQKNDAGDSNINKKINIIYKFYDVQT
jgi:hypothetical protein